jgi:hypothetical protein
VIKKKWSPKSFFAGGPRNFFLAPPYNNKILACGRRRRRGRPVVLPIFTPYL